MGCSNDKEMKKSVRAFCRVFNYYDNFVRRLFAVKLYKSFMIGAQSFVFNKKNSCA